MASFKSILVPFDGSEQSHRALDTAIDIGTAEHAVKVTLLYVAPPTNFDDSAFEVAAKAAGVPELDDKMKAKVRKAYIESNREQLQEKVVEYFDKLPDNINLSISVANGKPNEVIVSYAADNGIDLIVMGRRGLGAIQAAMGSVSTAVLRVTDLPVLVVK